MAKRKKIRYSISKRRGPHSDFLPDAPEVGYAVGRCLAVRKSPFMREWIVDHLPTGKLVGRARLLSEAEMVAGTLDRETGAAFCSKDPLKAEESLYKAPMATLRDYVSHVAASSDDKARALTFAEFKKMQARESKKRKTREMPYRRRG